VIVVFVSAGALLTVPSTEAGAAEDGLINVNAGDVLTVTYTEPTDHFGLPSIRKSTITVGELGSRATLTVSPVLVFENDPICITVADPDLTKQAVVAGSTTTIRPPTTSTTPWNSTTGTSRSTTSAARTTTTTPRSSSSTAPATTATSATQVLATTTTLSLLTSGINTTVVITRSNLPAQTATLLPGLQSGSYSACVPTFTGNSSVGLRFAQRGQLLTISYSDNAFYGNVSAQVVVSRKGRIQVTPTVIGMSRTLYVTVTDQDLNQNFSRVETAVVQVSSSWQDVGNNTVRLTETGMNSENFTGTLNTILNGAPSPKKCDLDTNGCVEALSVGLAVHVRDGDLLTFLYRDVAVGSSATEPTNDQAAVVRVGVKGAVLLSSCVTGGTWAAPLCGRVLNGGRVLLLQVDDADLDFDYPPHGLPRSTSVTVTTSKDAQVETVMLTETYPGSGSFTGDPSAPVCCIEVVIGDRRGIDRVMCRPQASWTRAWAPSSARLGPPTRRRRAGSCPRPPAAPVAQVTPGARQPGTAVFAERQAGLVRFFL
jgi:hypothetical protein